MNLHSLLCNFISCDTVCINVNIKNVFEQLQHVKLLVCTYSRGREMT